MVHLEANLVSPDVWKFRGTSGLVDLLQHLRFDPEIEYYRFSVNAVPIIFLPLILTCRHVLPMAVKLWIWGAHIGGRWSRKSWIEGQRFELDCIPHFVCIDYMSAGELPHGSKFNIPHAVSRQRRSS